MSRQPLRQLIHSNLIRELRGREFGDESASEWNIRWQLETLCRIDGRLSDWFRTAKFWAYPGYVVQLLRATLEGTSVEVKSVYAEVAAWLDYLPTDRLLTETEFDHVSALQEQLLLSRDISCTGVRDLLGRPSWTVDRGLEKVFCYGGIDKNRKWVFFDFKKQPASEFENSYEHRLFSIRDTLDNIAKFTEFGKIPKPDLSASAFFKTVRDCLQELSSIEIQRQAWLHPSKSSLEEVIAQLFEDMGVSDLIRTDRLAAIIGRNAATSMTELQEAIHDLDVELPFECFIMDSRMEVVRQLAKTTLANLPREVSRG